MNPPESILPDYSSLRSAKLTHPQDPLAFYERFFHLIKAYAAPLDNDNLCENDQAIPATEPEGAT